MKTRLSMVLATAGIAVILSTGCVSSKKYKSSQASLQQVRNDSARLAQQVASLNENVHSLEEKNTTLQRSLDSSSTNYANQQKNLDYYQTYFSQQQSAMTQVSDDLKGTLSQAGLSNADIQQVDNTIYVRLNGDDIFKKNSTAVTTSGKQALSGIAQVIKSRQNVNVSVASDDSAGAVSTGSMSSTGNDNTAMADNTSGNMSSVGAAPKHRTHHRSTAARSTAKSTQSSAATSADGSTASNAGSKTGNAPAHKKVHRKYSSEGGMTYYNNSRGSKSKAWALKQARMNSVANSFLQNGVPKVNLSLEQTNGNPTNNNIKVIITPTMSDFSPKSTSMNTESK